MHATVSATPTVNISGTAMRSARATARGPRHTTIVAIKPSAIAHAVCEAPAGRPTRPRRAPRRRRDHIVQRDPREVGDIQDDGHQRRTGHAERRPAAMIDGTRRRGPSGASAATSAAPATARGDQRDRMRQGEG